MVNLRNKILFRAKTFLTPFGSLRMRAHSPFLPSFPSSASALSLLTYDPEGHFPSRDWVAGQWWGRGYRIGKVLMDRSSCDHSASIFSRLSKCLILTLLLPPRKSSMAVSSLDFDCGFMCVGASTKKEIKRVSLSILPHLQLLICYLPFPHTFTHLDQPYLLPYIPLHCLLYIRYTKQGCVCEVKQSCGWKQVCLVSSLPLLTVYACHLILY